MQNLETASPLLYLPIGGMVHRLLPRLLNRLSAPANRKAIAASRRQLEILETQLATMATTIPHASAGTVPPILHFVFLSNNSQPFPYYAKMAILSAMHYNPGWAAFMHFTYEPTGPHWNSLRSSLILNQVPDLAYFGIAPLRHFAHKADLIRLFALRHLGGAYLDLDTITQNSFEPLRRHSFVMGIQAALPGQPGGLCNAIMLGARDAPFTNLWLQQFQDFRSRGTDWLWDYMSVKTPALLARKAPKLVTILKPEAFFDPLWDRIDDVLFNERPAAASHPNFAFHLWGNTIRARLAQISPAYIKTSNSLYAQIARPVAKAFGEI